MDKFKKFLLNRELIKHYSIYIFYGVLATIVDFGTFYLLKKSLPSLDDNVSNFISITVATIFAYFTNRKYVFKSKDSNIFSEFWKFAAARAFSMLFNIITFWAFDTFTHLNDYLVKVGISIVVIILNYIFSKFFVFNNKDNK